MGKHQKLSVSKQFNDIIVSIVDWIIGYTRSINVGLAMTNLNKFRIWNQLKCLEANAHFINFPKKHPIWTIKEYLNTKKSKNHLLPHVFKSKLFIDYEKSGKSFKSFKKSIAESELCSKVLPCYIIGTKTHSIDSVISVKDPKLRNLLIYWRVGIFGFNNTCNACGDDWSRTHLESCLTLLHEIDIPEDEWLIYKSEKHNIQLKFSHAKNYTILDSLINRSKFGLLTSVFSKILLTPK